MSAPIDLESLFSQAVEIDDDARRREFVEAACAGKPALRRELEQLLAASGKIGTFLELPAGAEFFSTPPQPLVGEKPGTAVGPYKLLEQIGEGGMGLVFMAEQTQPLRRRVALKVIKPGLDTRSVIARFEAERQALALMDHPNIARVYDAGATESGRPFFVMELVRGVPITEYCDQRHTPLRERLNLFMKVCDAVQHAHRKGIIHRDIKPTNILVTQNDTGSVPKVIDFGVAKAMTQPLTERTLFTAFSQIIGTPLYMSPEQADSGNQDIDTRSDVYSLGVVLYELLTGTTPFDVERLRSAGADEMRRIVREEEPPKPSTRATTDAAAKTATLATHPRPFPATAIKGDLDWIVMRALEKDRRRRYESPVAIVEDLERFLENQPVHARPPSYGNKIAKWLRRHSQLVAFTLIATTFLALVLAASTFIISRSYHSERKQREITAAALRQEEIAKRSNQALLVQSLIEKGCREFNDGDVSGLHTFLEACRVAHGTPSLEASARDYWTLAHAWLAGSMVDAIPSPLASAIHREGNLIAWCDDKAVYLRDPSSHRDRVLTASPGLLEVQLYDNDDHHDSLGMRFSPDGRYLVLHNAEQGAACLWSVAAANETPKMLMHPVQPPLFWTAGHRTLCFSPDSSRLATAAHSRTLCVWDLPTGKLALPPMELDGPVSSVSFDPSGHRIAVSFQDDSQRSNRPAVTMVFDVRDWHSSEIRLEHQGAFYSPESLFLDESRLAVTDAMATGRVWNVDRRQELFPLQPFDWHEDIDVSVNGQLLAAGGRDGTATLWSTTDGKPLIESMPHGGGGVRCVGFSPRGDTLVTGGLDGTVQYWTIANPARRLSRWPQLGTIEQIHVARDAPFLLTKSRTRDRSQPADVVVRRLPAAPIQKFGQLPPNSVGFAVDSSAKRYAVATEDRKRLWIGRFDRDDPEEAAIDSKAGSIFTSWCFHPNGRRLSLVESTESSSTLRCWDLDAKGYLSTEYSPVSSGDGCSGVGPILSTSPPQAVLTFRNWQFERVDTLLGKSIAQINAGGRTFTSKSVPSQSGLYFVGDSSGTIRRYRLRDHEEVAPRIRLPGPGRFMEATGDGNWLLTVDNFKDASLRCWRIGGDPPFFSLRFPWPYEHGQPFAVSDRTFLIRGSEGELLKLQLPLACGDDLQTLEQRTWLALGTRRRSDGELDLISAREWHALRESLSRLATD